MFRRSSTVWYEWPVFCFTWVGCLWVFVYEVFFVMAAYYPDLWLQDPRMKVHLNLMLFLGFHVLSNLVMVVCSSSACKLGTGEPDLLKVTGWKYCETCARYMPPRSYHCKICNQCILRRQHHCWFTGTCIGFRNHRHFVTMLLYGAVTGIYLNAYNWPYVVEGRGGFSWAHLPGFLWPWLSYMLGFCTTAQFLLTMNTMIGFVFTCVTILVLVLQLRFIFQGQLPHEEAKGINAYSRGLGQMVRDVFGSSGLLVLVFPFIPTKFPGDPSHFKSREHKV